MKKLSSTVLILGAGATFLIFGISPHDKFHPLITISSLLPLQIATLFWLKSNGYISRAIGKQ